MFQEMIIMILNKNKYFTAFGQTIHQCQSWIAYKIHDLSLAELAFKIKNNELGPKTFVRGLIGRIEDMI